MEDNSRRHAYLIMMHKSPNQMAKLLRSLDHERNDIYVHCDIKHKGEYISVLKRNVKKSGLFFTKRIDVRWGDYSLIQCELLLLESAIGRRYQYYHFLSGQDLPLKSQEEILLFFDSIQGKSVVGLWDDTAVQKMIYSRIRLYTLFQDGKWRNYAYKIQERLGVNRLKDNMKYGAGVNWVDVTHELAEYILSHKRFIKKHFSYGKAADELFIPTLVLNSEFIDKIYKGEGSSLGLRHLDFARGPDGSRTYTFLSGDFEELKNSKALFARKFEEEADAVIIERVLKELVGITLDAD